jgi:hypothetical protein
MRLSHDADALQSRPGQLGAVTSLVVGAHGVFAISPRRLSATPDSWAMTSGTCIGYPRRRAACDDGSSFESAS